MPPTLTHHARRKPSPPAHTLYLTRKYIAERGNRIMWAELASRRPACRKAHVSGGVQKLVLLAISQVEKRRVTQDQLAEIAGLCTATVGAAISVLEAQRLIKIHAADPDDTALCGRIRGCANSYEIDWARLGAMQRVDIDLAACNRRAKGHRKPVRP